jgi:Skp family chaperone for outer membrane proteins
MPKSSRVALAACLGLIGLGALVRTTSGQNDQPAGKTAAPPPPAPARIGAIDMDRVFKEYKKVKFTSEQLKNDATAKQGELQKLMAQMRQIAGELEGLAPGSNDYKGKEGELTKLKVQLEADREQAQADFARREAEALATIYREVQEMTAKVARYKGLNYVVKVSSEPVSGNEPQSVMAAMARSVVYNDPSMDITEMVIYNLNSNYEKAVGATTPAPTGDAATRPAAATGTPPTTRPPAAAASRPAAPGTAQPRR